MTFEEGFKQQWESLTNYLLSEMLKSSKNGGTVDLDAAEQQLAAEKKGGNCRGNINMPGLRSLEMSIQRSPKSLRML